MNTFWKILGGFLLFVVILIVGLNLYFTDERLKNTVQPYLNDAVGREVQVENMSLSFFTTFPHPGVEINNMRIPGETERDTLLTLNRLVAGVELFPLFRDQVNVTELVLNNPRFTYTIYADSTTNLDFFFEEDPNTTQSAGYNVNIPYFEISNGYLGYQDQTSNTSATLDDFDGDLSLNYADSIATSIDVEVGGFYATVDSINYMDGIPLTLTEESTIFPDREVIQLQEGIFSIRGLEMDLTGSLNNWSDTFTVDLSFNSSSDNFGDLLRLMPENEYTQGLETQGSLDLGGTISGPITEESTPNFDIRVSVENGYLKDPDLPEPIEDIQIAANATNKVVTIDNLNAIAGANTVNGSGTLNNPLEDDATFNMDFVADVDLSTVNQFYDITEMGIEQLAGQLDVDANAKGVLNEAENATFNGKAVLASGMLKYEEVPKAIQNININASGTQDLLTIKSLSLQAAQNSLSADGQVQHLLDENSRRINMNTNLQFDLATIKDFYPIDEDTLKLEGILTAQATLNGKADQIERAVQSGSITLKNGLVDYKEFDTPFRNITFESVLDGPRMTIVEGRLNSGDNSIQAAGVIDNYLSENRTVKLKTEGSAKLNEISNYYELAPDIQELSGDADFNLTVNGPLNNPSAMAFSGEMTIKNGNMSGESLRQPVQKLNGTFSLSPDKATLDQLTFKLGSSDIKLQGALSNYMQYLKDENKRTATPQVTGQYYSKYLDVDELIDWSDTTSSFNLQLPDLNSNISATIDRMEITGVTMRNLKANATTTPQQINMKQAQVELFEGRASGTMTWQIPADQPSTFNFKGSLDSLRLESFFKEYPILGEQSEFYKFITGTFSTNIDYSTKITPELEPLIATTVLNGNFGMSKAQIDNHPLQQKMAGYTKINELRNVALDQWQSSISVDDNVLTISDLSLTSDNIGMQLNGTQSMVNENIDFSIALLLPGRFKSTIASVITAQAADALTRENGTLMIPLRVTGTYSNPKFQPDQTVIKPMIKQGLKDKAKNTLKDLFGRDNKEEAKQDSSQVDTTGN